MSGDWDARRLLSPDEAFALLGDPTRLEILRVLWDAYTPSSEDNAVQFSELFERVGYEDTGNFNYHLQKLVDHFVRRTPTGYALSGSGHAIVQAIIAGSVTDSDPVDPASIDVPCSQCGAPIEVDYVGQRTFARCTECAGIFGGGRMEELEESLFHLPFPPGGWVDRSPEEVFHATVKLNFHQIACYRDGVCPHCAGVVDETVHVCEDHAVDETGHCPSCDRAYQIEVRETCRRCKASEWGPLTIAILTHPMITAFYHDNGVEHRFASWASFERGATIEEEVIQDDPLRMRVTIPCGTERLRIILDESLAILEATEETSHTRP